MNGKDLLIGLGSISPKYYDEAENDTITEVKRHRTFRRPLLVAAIIALTLLLVGCAVVYAYSYLTKYFIAQSNTPLSSEQLTYIEDQEQSIGHAVTNDGWTVQIKSALNDGRTAYIILGITAPDIVNLESSENKDYFLGGEWDELLSNNQQIEILSRHAGWINDDDGKMNTQDYIIRWEPIEAASTQDPYGSDVVWNIHFENIIAKIEDTAYYQELLEGKYKGQSDIMFTSEETEKLYSEEIIANGIWDFCFSFDQSSTGIEVISSPITVEANVHRYAHDARDAYEYVTISSFTLNSFSAVIKHDANALVYFRNRDGEEIAVVMNDGSEIVLYDSSTTRDTCELHSSVPIVLSEVNYIRMPDGTILSISD